MKAKIISCFVLAAVLLSSCIPVVDRSEPTTSPTRPSLPSPTLSPSPTSPSPESSLPPLQVRGPDQAWEVGAILHLLDVYGTYFLYRPTKPSDPPQSLVVIHGTPAQELSAEETAFYYAQHWAAFAEEQGWLLLVPAFNQADFSSRQGEITDALTGYRGLFGREIGADAWVLRLVGLARETLDWPETPFLIYGHSAGGQFVGRFLVTHPDQVERAVISAAVTYPQPDPEIAWPYGMGSLSSVVTWEDGTSFPVQVTPEKEAWLRALQVPTLVIVGLNDLEPQLSRPGQSGSVRLSIGRNWVQAMAEFGAENGVQSQITFEAVPGKGHSMLGLLPFCQQAFLESD